MSLIAQRLGNIKPSPTIAVTTKAAELKAQGKDVIGLGAGEPDFDTPDFIKDAAKKALDEGKTKYTPVDGTPELKKAIVAKFERENGLKYDVKQISVGNGGKQVIYNALMATVNPGEEVIIPAPYWVSYPDMTILAQGTPVFIQCGAEHGFKLQPDQLRKAITPKTKWLILNSPSNPTGAAYTEAELKALAAVLLDFPQVLIMVDDIYEHVVYDGFKFTTLAQVEPRLYDRTLTVNGMAKAFSMTGWRIGFAGGPQPIIKAMADVQSHSTSNPCSISQAAATVALNGSREFLKDWLVAFKARRDLVVGRLNAMPGISCNTPEGAFYVFPDARKLIGKTTPAGKKIANDTELAGYLLEDALSAVVQGSAFGLDGFFRISYATSEANLIKAMDRIGEAVSKLK